MILNLFGKSSINKNSIDSLVESYRNLNIEQATTEMQLNNVADAEIRATLSKKGYIEADIEQAMATKANNVEKKTNIALTKLQSAGYATLTILAKAANIALSAGINVILSLIATKFITWLENVINHEKNLAKSAEEAKTKIEELNNSFITQKNTIKEYAKEYAELAQGVDSLTNKNLSLSTEDYDRFLEISNILSDTFPILTKRIDDNGNSILDLDGDVNSIVGSLNSLIETQQRLVNQEIVENIPDIYEDYYNNLEKANKKIEEQVNIQDKLTEARDILLKSSNFYTNNSDGQKQYQDALDYLDFDYGVSVGQNSNGVMGMVYNVENLKSDQDIVAKYNELYHKSLQDIQTYEDNINIKLSGLNQALSSALSTDYIFSNLNSELQAGITELFQTFDYTTLPETIDSSNGEQVYNYLRSIYLSPIDQLTEEIQIKLSQAFSKPIDMSDVDYISLIDELQAYFDQNNIKINLDFVVADERDLQDRLSNAISDITSNRKVDKDLLSGFMDTESIDSSSEIEFFLDVTKGAESASEAIKMYNKAIKESKKYEDIDDDAIFENLDNIRSAYNTVSDAIKEYRDTKHLTLETVEQLLQLDDKYLSFLYDENGQLTLNTETYNKLTQAKLDEMYVSIINDTLNTISSLESEEAAAHYLKLTTEDLTAANWDLVESEFAAAEAILQAEEAQGGQTSARRTALDEAMSTAKARVNLLKEASKGMKYDNFYESYSSSSKKENDFSKEFDWIANSVDNVSRAIDNLNEKLNNTTGFKERLKVYDELIQADKNLVKTTQNAAIAYEKEWNKASNKISNNYKNKIVSGKTFSVETITNETTADNIDKAQEAYENWQLMLQQYNQAVAQQKDDEQGKIQTLLELEELKLDILSLDNQEVMSAKEKNNYIKQEEILKANILKYNLQLAESEEEKTRLQKEYNEYLKENQQLVYENNKEERNNKINYYDSRVQDIQNAIDYSETKGGQGTEQQYTQMNKYIENQKALERANYDAALAMRNQFDYGTTQWEKYNEEIQAAQNNIYSLTTAQIENNRAILKLPIHALEKNNELLQEQLDIVTKTQERLEESINSASNIVQNQIDTLNEQKSVTEEYFDSQIESINEQKEALSKSNEEIERQLALEKAKYELEKAKNNRSVKIYREGQGFTYESDQEAIREAQENLDTEIYNNKIYQFDVQLDALEKAKEEAASAIDTQINSLELYKERIDSITSSYENMLQLQTLISMFGEDATDRLMSGDLSIIDEMQNLYNETTSQATSLQLQIKANEAAIEQIETYAEKWNGSSKTIATAKQLIEQTVSNNTKEIESIQQRTDTVKTINDAWEETRLKLEEELGFIQENQIIAKDDEEIVLQERLENIKSFSEKASAYLKQISNALSQAESKQAELNKISEGSVNKSPNNKTNNKINNKVTPQIKTMGKKHSGIASGYVGESNKRDNKDKFKYIALNELKPDEIPSLLLKGEAVLNNDQISNVLDNMKNALISGINLVPEITPKVDLSSIKSRTESSSKTIEFNGDIVLNGVQNTDSLAKQIKNNFLIKLDQEFYKQ